MRLIFEHGLPGGKNLHDQAAFIVKYLFQFDRQIRSLFCDEKRHYLLEVFHRYEFLRNKFP